MQSRFRQMFGVPAWFFALILLGAFVWSNADTRSAVADAMHLHPPKTDKYDMGKSGLRWRNINAANATLANLTVSGTYNVDDLGVTDDATIGDALNVTGTTTLNALVGNSTANVTGLTTLNNATVNATKTLSALGPVVLGREAISANATITATCSTVVAITDLSGNITVSFNAPPAGVHHIIVDESGKLGIAGNVTVNVTSGTVNGLNNITLTNTTDTDGAGGSNVTAYRFHATSTTAGFLYR